MSINFNLPAKAQRKASPLKHYEATMINKQGLIVNDKKKDDPKGGPLPTSDGQVSEK